MKNIPVSQKQHSRAWLIKIRMRSRTLNEVIETALDALAEKEMWDDLIEKKN